MSAAKTKKQPGSVTFQVDAADMLKALHNARLFICPDVLLPVIRCVLIEGEKDWLTFTATDRYMLGKTRVPYTGEAFTFTMQEADSALLLRLFTPKSGSLDVTVENGKMTVQPAAGVVNTPQVVVTMTGYDGEFPKYRVLLDSARKAPEEKPVYNAGDIVAVNPRYIAKFSRVKPVGDINPPLKLEVRSPLAPIYATVGENFEAIIMPVRTADSPATVQSKTRKESAA
jgi:hypothetical protein